MIRFSQVSVPFTISSLEQVTLNGEHQLRLGRSGESECRPRGRRNSSVNMYCTVAVSGIVRDVRERSDVSQLRAQLIKT